MDVKKNWQLQLVRNEFHVIPPICLFLFGEFLKKSKFPMWKTKI